MRLRPFVAAAMLLSLGLFARADTFTTFNVSGSSNTNPNITIGGTFTLDTTTGQVTSNDLTVSQGGSSVSLVNDVTFAGSFTTPNSSAVIYGLEFGPFPGTDIFLDFNQSSLIGYTGGGICGITSPCSNGATSTAEFGSNDQSLDTASAAPVPVSPVPEPSSMLLLGTGLLGIAGVLRMRYA